MQIPRIVVLVGLPGSGKSTYLERLGVTALSSDGVRGLLADDVTDQSIHREVFATVRYLLRRRLALARPTSPTSSGSAPASPGVSPGTRTAGTS